MKTLPLRLPPDSDIRQAVEAALDERVARAAFVVGGIGSLRQARLRLAGRDEADPLSGELEILTLGGSISTNGAHLHMSLADADGRVIGGHVGYGCLVHTTAELLIVLLPEWSFSRERDPVTGYLELAIRDVP